LRSSEADDPKPFMISPVNHTNPSKSQIRLPSPLP